MLNVNHENKKVDKLRISAYNIVNLICDEVNNED